MVRCCTCGGSLGVGTLAVEMTAPDCFLDAETESRAEHDGDVRHIG
ncbi:hypothetical protein HMPREF0293_1875 [Corynebacterium glucuronolyticum ATCC 51866]|uniref:Uncharacterized protein n=1 Tax=Corynebacterium glucuronolyticum ATCC 51866 TaxID=548478 RepID=A0ABM9XNN0_9CORY|nr:hypothetical protein HMPREF0293_1875 [Corynebacterium glucuronolyticum ATCC 51866]